MSQANVPLPAKLEVSRPGDHFLITVPHYWGKGATLAAAAANLRAAGGELKRHWRVYSVNPETTLDEFGGINYRSGHPPVVLAESNPVA